ncbi:MAG: methyltransferase domain-containing protein [Verrucomicrobiota bacterium]
MKKILKTVVRNLPIIGPILIKIRNNLLQMDFQSSRYWEERYLHGGNSGMGSYAHLANFKADFINQFIMKNNISSVIEFGCGDGNQLRLANYKKYTGFDVSDTVLDACRKLFKDDPSKEFKNISQWNPATRAELTLSLDVIYHLVEDNVFYDYMTKLFDSAEKYVVIYSSNVDATQTIHVKHRQFDVWITDNRPQFKLLHFEKNKYPYSESDPDHTSFADFYIYSKLV